MKLSKAAFLMGAALIAGAPLAAPAPAAAQGAESIYVPLFTYRTGAFAGSGIPIANGMRDYLTMLNERDGGIGGVKLVIEECETSYDAKKGLECYEAVKPKNPVMINPWSTGTTLPLIPRASVDKIPVLSMAYGLSSSAKGDVFPWVFNPPATYWDGFTQILQYIAQQEGGGVEKLKGLKIGYIFLDSGFGREPLPLIEKLSKELGFEPKLYPVAAADMQNQSSQWLSVRRDRPNYMILYGWGALNATAINEAVRTNFPMEKFVSIWWPGEDDAAGAGAAATGFKTLNWHGVGADFPLIQDIKTHVVDKGLSQTAPEKLGQVLYNRGVYNSMLIAEAIRTAQEITGKKVVTGEDVRRGLENLNVDEARLEEIGLGGFTSPVKLTCSDHNGHFPVFVQRWDGDSYERVTDYIEPLKEYVLPLLEEDAKSYAEKNAPWPTRTEPCDNPG